MSTSSTTAVNLNAQLYYFEPLTQQNWNTWQLRMLRLFVELRVTGVVKGTEL